MRKPPRLGGGRSANRRIGPENAGWDPAGKRLETGWLVRFGVGSPAARPVRDKSGILTYHGGERAALPAGRPDGPGGERATFEGVTP